MKNINDKMIEWFKMRQGKVTYSMENRTGTKSYDCSSAVYYSVCNALDIKPEYPKNTVTLIPWLEYLGFKKVTKNLPWKSKKGDIVIWYQSDGVAGAYAHTGIFTSEDSIIHCNYNNNGISEDKEDTLMYLYQWNYVVYRYKTESEEIMQRLTDCKYKIKGNYSIDTLPWWCDDKINLGNTKKYQGKIVTVTRKWGNYWYAKELGFVDHRAFYPVKSLEEIAKEVINGQWGNGETRKEMLEKAGYNYDEVQKLVDKML